MYIHGLLYYETKQKIYHFRYLNAKKEEIWIDYRDTLSALNALSERKWEIVGTDLAKNLYLLRQPTQMTNA